MYSERIELMPPMPVPWVLATSDGCTQLISSAGLKPEDRNASTVHTMFQRATRSMELAISAEMPHLVGSQPVGIWPPTVRDSLALRGTRISVPALRVTCQSPEPSTGATTVCSGFAAWNARASASPLTTKVRSLSRNTEVSSGAALSVIAPSSP